MSTLRNIGIAILTAAILIGLWFGGWALYQANQSARYAANTHSQQWQAGIISQQRDRVTAYDIATDEGQKKQIATTFCAVYLDLNPAPADLTDANFRICN